ncbi:MAG: peptidyl-prolyl cis-trans isomerase [Nitrospiraceae bacterium]
MARRFTGAGSSLGGEPTGCARRTSYLLMAIAMTAALMTPAASARLVDRIVAVVNSEVIVLSELKAETETARLQLEEQYRGAELQRRLRQIEYIALNRMIERKLQMQLARTKGVAVSDEEMDRALRALRSQGEQVDGANPHDKKKIEEQLLVLKIVDQEVRSGVTVSDSDVKEYYEAHRSRFMLPAEYRLSQILLKPRFGETPDETRRRAEAVHAQLLEGGDFAELAASHSDGAEAIRGGSLGLVRQGELVPVIERAVGALQPGQVSEPLQTSQGYHILRLDERKPPRFRPFANVKREIEHLVYQEKSEDIYQDWIAELEDNAYIEVKF